VHIEWMRCAPVHALRCGAPPLSAQSWPLTAGTRRAGSAERGWAQRPGARSSNQTPVQHDATARGRAGPRPERQGGADGGRAGRPSRQATSAARHDVDRRGMAWGVTSSPVALMSTMTSRRWAARSRPITSHRESSPHVVDDVLRYCPVARRLRATSPDGRRIGYRRVKVRWVTPLGDETASMS
jgi:hypothetical protein